jgi:hypothetical protein
MHQDGGRYIGWIPQAGEQPDDHLLGEARLLLKQLERKVRVKHVREEGGGEVEAEDVDVGAGSLLIKQAEHPLKHAPLDQHLDYLLLHAHLLKDGDAEPLCNASIFRVARLALNNPDHFLYDLHTRLRQIVHALGRARHY